MDILKILENSAKELYPEDLDFFETELATGDYNRAYINACKSQIKKIRKWMESGEDDKANNSDSQAIPQKSTGVVVDIADVAPKDANPVAASMKPEEFIFHDIKNLRNQNSYKTLFKKYVSGKSEIDADFVDKHYSFFAAWELDAIVSVKQMGEDFLEKYFGALDKDKIARYQIFSEAFFMKHYSQMDANIVLLHGKNEWRKKENRSKQLDVFLRLKGVKI